MRGREERVRESFRRIRAAQGVIDRQSSRIVRLTRNKRNTAEAKALLEIFKCTLAVLKDHRKVLIKCLQGERKRKKQKDPL
jgi:hypothetical protein